MSQKTVVTLIDDLDESEASQTVEFGLDGVSLEIDLNDDHAQDLRDALAPFVAHARRTSGRRPRSRATRRPASSSSNGSSSAEREENRRMRDWARSQGYEVSERGRVPNPVKDAYAQRGAA